MPKETLFRPRFLILIALLWAYNEYIGAVEYAIEKQHNIKEFCDAGGGRLSELTFGISRMSIDEAIARLGPAIDNANALLGQ